MLRRSELENDGLKPRLHRVHHSRAKAKPSRPPPRQKQRRAVCSPRRSGGSSRVYTGRFSCFHCKQYRGCFHYQQTPSPRRRHGDGIRRCLLLGRRRSAERTDSVRVRQEENETSVCVRRREEGASQTTANAWSCGEEGFRTQRARGPGGR